MKERVLPWIATEIAICYMKKKNYYPINRTRRLEAYLVSSANFDYFSPLWDGNCRERTGPCTCLQFCHGLLEGKLPINIIDIIAMAEVEGFHLRIMRLLILKDEPATTQVLAYNNHTWPKHLHSCMNI